MYIPAASHFYIISRFISFVVAIPRNMKKLLLSLFCFLSFALTAQVTWNRLPDTPVSPSAGSVFPESGDLTITDDGSVFTAYMYDNGTGLRLYFKQYVAGTGWVDLYDELVYLGSQTVKSQKVGNDAYVVVKTGNVALTPLFKVFKVSSSGVVMISSFTMTDYQDAAGFDFEMGTDISYGYLLHRGSSGTNLKLTKIDYAANNAFGTVTAIVGLSSLDAYDMTITGDTIFAVVSATAPTDKLFLFKTDVAAATLEPYSNASSTGELFNGGNSITCHNPMINSNDEGKVFVLGYDQGNIAGVEKMYYNDAITDLTWSGNIAEYYSTGATVGAQDYLFYLNNYSPSNAPPYNTYVAVRNIDTDDYDTLAAPTGYILATNSPKEHRLELNPVNKRFTASFYNPVAGQREYYLSNNLPFIDPADINQTPQLCATQSNDVFFNFAITDENGEVPNILNIFSSDISIIDPATAGSYFITQSGTKSYFTLYATGLQPGSVTLSIEVTDGYDTLTITLPIVTVIAPNPPVFNVTDITICSGQGIVDLNDYVSMTGGNFYINSLEIGFPEGQFDTDNSMLSADNPQTLSYDYNDGVCNFTITANIVYHIAPDVTMIATPTVCGGTTGTATATITGGATPYTFNQWSSGEQNTTNVSGLAAGQYAFTVIDANSCLVNEFFEIGTSGTTVTPTISDVSCFGLSDGSITLATTGLTAPIVSLWSTGHSTMNLSNLPAGNYTINLTDAAGCSISETFTVTQPEKLETGVDVILPSCGTFNGSLHAVWTNGGVAPYTYAWSDGQNGPDAIGIPFGIYSLTTTDVSGCMVVNTLYVGESGGADLTANVTPADCGADNGAIDVYAWLPASTYVTAVDWSNGATTEDIMNVAPALYTCTLTVSNGCRALKGWNLPVVEPLRNDICVVTVDSATTTNLVVWEPVQESGIAYYNIYRETSIQNDFALIDTVHATNLSLFNDVVASPLSRSWRYKIGAVNACGTEGPLSAAHQTIHLDVIDNGGINVTVNWNAYEGAVFSNYIVSRYTNANGWEVIATVPTTQFSYTDAVPFSTPGLDYMVEIALDVPCTAVVWRAQDFNSARSNKERGQFSVGNGTGDSNNEVDEIYLSQITVSPNPSTGLFTVRQNGDKTVEMVLTGVDGQQLLAQELSGAEVQLDLTGYADGIYFITVHLNNAKQTYRIIKQ